MSNLEKRWLSITLHQIARRNIDIIKDDELLGDPEYSKPWERVKAYRKVAEMAAAFLMGKMLWTSILLLPGC